MQELLQEFRLPEWVGTAAAWASSLIVAGGAKPVFDWWKQREQDRGAEKQREEDMAVSLRRELRESERELRADLDKRDDEIEVVRRELYELLAKIASLTAENHNLRAEKHRMKNWITSFYLDLQIRWNAAGLPVGEFPVLPRWVTQSTVEGPTASFSQESS